MEILKKKSQERACINVKKNKKAKKTELQTKIYSGRVQICATEFQVHHKGKNKYKIKSCRAIKTKKKKKKRNEFLTAAYSN